MPKLVSVSKYACLLHDDALDHPFSTFRPFPVFAALSFPIGMSTDGLPAALQLGVLPGSDEKLLSMALAIEKLVGKLQPPPSPQCSGCQANVKYAPVRLSAPRTLPCFGC